MLYSRKLRREISLDHPQSRSVVTSMCGVCPAGCGVNVQLINGRLERAVPLREHPQGIGCPRGAAAREIVYSKDRLLHPQHRVDSELKRVSWDEAYTTLTAKLRQVAEQHGPESICIYTGRGNFEFGLNEAYAPTGTVESSANAVLFPFGSPNTAGVGSFCYASFGMIAPLTCFGDVMRNMLADLEHAELILVWGANPATDSPPIHLRRLHRARKRGARIIVIDHRRSETARALPAEWIGVRPGTDGALALGLIHVLIQEDLYDHQFVRRWTFGFDELTGYAQQFTPEHVERITGVPARRLRKLARAMGSTEACSVLMYSGLEYSSSGVQAIRAVWSLQAMTGHLDVRGGNLFKMRDRPKLRRLLTDPPTSGRKPIGAEEYPLYHQVRNEAHAALLPRTILEGKPYAVRAMIISGASLITSWADPDLWRRALAALDLLVVINRFPTADAQYAHLILPATTLFENESYMSYDCPDGSTHVQLRQRVIAPRGEARSDTLIFAELAHRLGYGHLWPQTEQSMIAHALQGSGITVDQLRAHPEGIRLRGPRIRLRKYETGSLRADGMPGFETPTGKFEFLSQLLRQHGHEPLPVYTEPLEGPLASPDLARRFPLVFNSGARTQSSFRSQHYNIPSLVSRQPRPLVHIHETDARARGIVDGDDVVVISPRGKVPFTARVTRDIVRGTVEANMGGGGPIGEIAWQRANVNELTDLQNRDPISGFPVYKALLCDVVRRDGDGR